MSTLDVISNSNKSCIGSFADILCANLESGEDFILTPYGYDTLSVALNLESALVEANSLDFLKPLAVITKFHSNAFAFYFTVSTGINMMHFKQFAYDLEHKHGWEYISTSRKPTLNHIFDAYEKLNALSERCNETKEHYNSLIKILTKLILDHFMGAVYHPCLPKSDWKVRSGLEYHSDAPWLVRSEYQSKNLYTNFINGIQYLTTKDTLFSPWFFCKINGYFESHHKIYGFLQAQEFEVLNDEVYLSL